jgi:Ni,Fe-hydrogenase III component G
MDKQSLLLRSKTTKLKELTLKREKYQAKLKNMYSHFRGVKHENSLSELQYSEIKVYEDMLNSVTEEITKLKLD